jgi:hypothetical protein
MSEPKMKVRSFVPEIRSHLHDGWMTCDLRFATEMEATFYVVDLMLCKPPPAITRIVPSEDEPTHIWLNHAGALRLSEKVG